MAVAAQARVDLEAEIARLRSQHAELDAASADALEIEADIAEKEIELGSLPVQPTSSAAAADAMDPLKALFLLREEILKAKAALDDAVAGSVEALEAEVAVAEKMESEKGLLEKAQAALDANVCLEGALAAEGARRCRDKLDEIEACDGASAADIASKASLVKAASDFQRKANALNRLHVLRRPPDATSEVSTPKRAKLAPPPSSDVGALRSPKETATPGASSESAVHDLQAARDSCLTNNTVVVKLLACCPSLIRVDVSSPRKGSGKGGPLRKHIALVADGNSSGVIATWGAAATRARDVLHDKVGKVLKIAGVGPSASAMSSASASWLPEFVMLSTATVEIVDDHSLASSTPLFFSSTMLQTCPDWSYINLKGRVREILDVDERGVREIRLQDDEDICYRVRGQQSLLPEVTMKVGVAMSLLLAKYNARYGTVLLSEESLCIVSQNVSEVSMSGRIRMHSVAA